MANALIPSNSLIGVGLLGIAAYYILTSKQEAVALSVGSKTDSGGHWWANEMGHFYGEDEPDIPIADPAGAQMDTTHGLETRLVASRQSFLKQLEAAGEEMMENFLPHIIGHPQDESNWQLEPRYLGDRQPRANEIEKKM